ncbi:SUN domain-containing ossification factor isoform X7 [Silurus asotus]|uniref:SUN domain-containing ossification factor isoform X7 n=1 Tax=Silurus asotus TaxID=30991 RepID=A0AAD5FGN9_SILAS|nr:SUN domain-containing ossification factor isoform X7 [Silurus asotus]
MPEAPPSFSSVCPACTELPAIGLHGEHLRLISLAYSQLLYKPHIHPHSRLPMVLENGSTAGTGKSTKPSLGQTNQETHASSILKEKIVPATPRRDPAPPPPPDPEDILTFDEWTKSMMEEKTEKSQTTHTSYNGGLGGVKKVQKTTNYASVECGAKILASNPEAKVELLSHFGTEHFCPLSLLRVFGTCMAEELNSELSERVNYQDEDDVLPTSSCPPSSSEFYAEIPGSTDLPNHVSNQKSIFMRLNNRIKVLKVKMSLSGCYLEQLSQRYRMQMEEMQRAFYKAIIKLQSTLWNIEEQCKKNGESIQVLQKQMEKLSLQVSALQIYVLLSVVLSILSILIVIYLHYCRTSDLNPPQEPKTCLPKSYSCCCPDSMETVEVDQLESLKVIETLSMTEGGQRGPTVPLLSPSLSETTVSLTPELVQTTVTKEDQIDTLLPEDELEDQDKSSRSTLQKAEQESVMAPWHQQCSRLKAKKGGMFLSPVLISIRIPPAEAFSHSTSAEEEDQYEISRITFAIKHFTQNRDLSPSDDLIVPNVGAPHLFVSAIFIRPLC